MTCVSFGKSGWLARIANLAEIQGSRIKDGLLYLEQEHRLSLSPSCTTSWTSLLLHVISRPLPNLSIHWDNARFSFWPTPPITIWNATLPASEMCFSKPGTFLNSSRHISKYFSACSQVASALLIQNNQEGFFIFWLVFFNQNAFLIVLIYHHVIGMVAWFDRRQKKNYSHSRAPNRSLCDEVVPTSSLLLTGQK